MKQTLQTVATIAALLATAEAFPKPKGMQKRQNSSIVTGSPLGFASGVTGGGDAAAVYPTTIDELTEYLTSDSPQNIVISGTYDFTGSEGTQSIAACNGYSCTPEEGGQALLNTLDACTEATYDVTVDTAGMTGIQVTSDKTLVGTDGATLIGKGLRLVNADNVIIQNIAITDLNPAYVWGGDALTFSDTSNVWVDHVHTKSLGRQHYSFGTGASTGIAISNSFIDGETSQSATCDGHTYWGLELVGSGDEITFYKNHLYYTSGRSPALSGTTLFHAVNNVFSSNSGHLIEGDTNGAGIYEGNYFVDVPVVIQDGWSGAGIFASQASSLSACQEYLGRDCVENVLDNSGAFDYDDAGVLAQLSGKTIVDAESADAIQDSVVSGAGNTL